MSTCTPVYGFTYAVGTDRPCDINTTMCQFVDEVETELDRLDAVVDRVVDSRPMARVRMTVPLTVVIPISQNFSTSLSFDTVDVDTANMVNLTNNPASITLPRPGIYFTNFTIELANLLANDTIGAFVVSNVCSDQEVGTGSAVFLNGSFNMLYNPVSQPRDISVATLTLGIFSSVNAQTLTFTSASLSTIWLRDLP